MAGHNFWLVGDIAKDPEALASQYFIARVTSHIPDKGQVMIRYYGLYSNAHRGKMLNGHHFLTLKPGF